MTTVEQTAESGLSRRWQGAYRAEGEEAGKDTESLTETSSALALEYNHVMALRILQLDTMALRRILSHIANKQKNDRFDPDLPVRLVWEGNEENARLCIVNDGAGTSLHAPLPLPARPKQNRKASRDPYLR